eukprot:TRINITY_DN2873_c0_g1_i3.p1 TRINITY_DN2873_c0_g1~~TRINITY_DN2873_c0_g1_i3.p1  ORF type:complete len:186 (+),score=32.82 TRINITY_DN2873_c0_g1_i3:356-913(+)
MLGDADAAPPALIPVVASEARQRVVPSVEPDRAPTPQELRTKLAQSILAIDEDDNEIPSPAAPPAVAPTLTTIAGDSSALASGKPRVTKQTSFSVLQDGVDGADVLRASLKRAQANASDDSDGDSDTDFAEMEHLGWISPPPLTSHSGPAELSRLAKPQSITPQGSAPEGLTIKERRQFRKTGKQ